MEDAVFASQSYDDPGEAPVFAFDAATGEERWRTITGWTWARQGSVSSSRSWTG